MKCGGNPQSRNCKRQRYQDARTAEDHIQSVIGKKTILTEKRGATSALTRPGLRDEVATTTSEEAIGKLNRNDIITMFEEMNMFQTCFNTGSV